MPREVIESTRIVIKTEAGNRVELSGKGSACRGMLTAFECLPIERQEWLLRRMWGAHMDRLAKEKAPGPQGAEG